MKMILIGAGKIGYAIARQLVGERHDIVVVDSDADALALAGDTLDVMTVAGNGASVSVLLEAGVRDADLVIAVTANDEVNLICCLLAKKLGAQHTVARVRNPEYFRDTAILRREVGLDLIINPEYAAAQEIARLLRVPSAFSVESFAGGIVELIGFQITESDGLAGRTLIDYNRQNPNSLLLCAARRGDEVIVPNGTFVPQVGDYVYTIGTPDETVRVFRRMGRATAPLRRVSVLGGGRVAQYLAWALKPLDANICIVEEDGEKCRFLSEQLPQCTILHGDGTDHDVIESEGLFEADALVALTDSDEENLLIALNAQRSGVGKVIPRVSRQNYTDLVHQLGLDTVVSPYEVTASEISRYVRGLANSQGSAVESLHRILGGAIEAVEFTASPSTHFLNTSLRDLRLQPGLLVAAIVHNGRMTTPRGDSQIREGDRVIVLAKKLFLKDLNDILEH